MAIIRWNPWNLQNFLDDDWDLPTIPGLSRLAGQGLNMYETEESLVVQASLPGVPEDKIDISVDDGIVRIAAEVSDKREENSNRKYFMSSIASSYNYSFRLPSDVADKEPKAELENGILNLVFEKMRKAPPKKIRIVGKNTGKKELK